MLTGHVLADGVLDGLERRRDVGEVGQLDDEVGLRGEVVQLLLVHRRVHADCDDPAVKDDHNDDDTRTSSSAFAFKLYDVIILRGSHRGKRCLLWAL